MTERLLEKTRRLHSFAGSRPPVRVFVARLTALLATAVVMGCLLLIAGAFGWGGTAIGALLLGLATYYGLARPLSRRRRPQSQEDTSFEHKSVEPESTGSKPFGQLGRLPGASKQALGTERFDGSKPVRLRPRRKRMLATTCVIGLTGIVVGAATIVGLNVGISPIADPATPPPVTTAANFTFPADGDEVASPILARGLADLPDNYSLWILTRPEDNRYYTVNTRPLIIDQENRWEFSVVIGQGPEDIGRSYDLFLVAGIAGSNSIDTAFRDHGSDITVAFEALPVDVTILDSVRVTLAGASG
ncbi:hypothetical protein JOD57_003611 [Geodermatophilus bullaregiensis]|uniref:hypothetical protein n=1 Tax=Geodermatophilus bullaregiensis TaxID=1564160 RepID=UPI0019594F10|nr:hypothetical protein [Geodermatophilus bullaregiensis]MBM7807774.1 hypothetical protein [Geodermatophilus bullaregiensis]